MAEQLELPFEGRDMLYPLCCFCGDKAFYKSYIEDKYYVVCSNCNLRTGILAEDLMLGFKCSHDISYHPLEGKDLLLLLEYIKEEGWWFDLSGGYSYVCEIASKWKRVDKEADTAQKAVLLALQEMME